MAAELSKYGDGRTIGRHRRNTVRVASPSSEIDGEVWSEALCGLSRYGSMLGTAHKLNVASNSPIVATEAVVIVRDPPVAIKLADGSVAEIRQCLEVPHQRGKCQRRTAR